MKDYNRYLNINITIHDMFELYQKPINEMKKLIIFSLMRYKNVV